MGSKLLIVSVFISLLLFQFFGRFYSFLLPEKPLRLLTFDPIYLPLFTQRGRGQNTQGRRIWVLVEEVVS